MMAAVGWSVSGFYSDLLKDMVGPWGTRFTVLLQIASVYAALRTTA
jgi:hypothetical protein